MDSEGKAVGRGFSCISSRELTLIDRIEGVVTSVIAIASYWLVCDFPEDCRFLSEEERAMLLARIKVDTADTHMDHLTWKTFLWIMKDWKIYCSGFMYLTCVTTSYSIALFLPTILKNMVHTNFRDILTTGLYFGSSSIIINWTLCQRLYVHYDCCLSRRPLPSPICLVHSRNHHLDDWIYRYHGGSRPLPWCTLLRHLPHDYRRLYHSTPHFNLVSEQPRWSL